MTVSVSIELRVQEGKQEAFEEFLKAALEETRQYDGCLFVNFGKDSADSSHYRLNGEWESEEKRQVYMKWRQETGMLDKMGEFVSAPPVFTIYSILWGRHFHM